MDLKKEFVTGFFWASSASGLAKAIDLIAMIVLARLLDPTIFGLIAIALLITNTLNIFSDLGLGAALIQKRNPTEDDNDTIFLVTPVLNLVIYIIAYLLAGPAGIFFGNENVVSIIKVLSLILIINSLRTVPSALLQKELRYKKLFITEVSSSITYFLVAVPLALSGMGVWSIVFGQLARYSAHGILLWTVSHWRPRWNFRWDSFRSLYGFGKHIVVLSVISFILKNLDNAVIAKFLTLGDLGLYTMAYTAGNILPQFIKMTIGKITFPFYSNWNEDHSNFKMRFLLINKINMFFCVWITLILITTSNIIIPILLGKKWAGTILLIQILALSGFQRAIASVYAPALNAIGVPQAQREPAILSSLIFVPLIIPVTKFFGVEGVAVLAATSIIPGFIWTVYRTFSLIGLKEELVRFFSPVLIGGIILAFWMFIDSYLAFGLLLNLIITFSVVSIIFVVAMWFIKKEIFSQIYGVLNIIREIV
jgi:O-antigen/teichoic acid export membrane protein